MELFDYIPKPEINSDGALQLLLACIKIMPQRDVADVLCVGVRTLRRWINIGIVPTQYVFELSRILSRPVDYSKYTYITKDQLYASTEIVMECWRIFHQVLGEMYNKYTFIEPSAGDGIFRSVLPKDTIYIDVDPHADGIIVNDYLTWQPPQDGRKYIVFGYPPNGVKGNTSLRFINHSSVFADHVCFILPLLFERDGKGCIRNKVLQYKLVYSQRICGRFRFPDGRRAKTEAVFQIWSK